MEFGITFGEVSVLDQAQVSFGALIYGAYVLDLIEKSATEESKVDKKVTIRDCGPVHHREVTFSEP